MSRPERAAGLLAVVVCAALAGGCATLGQGNSSASRDSSSSASGRQPLFQDDAPGASDGLTWSDFSIDKLGKTGKKLIGQGPNRDIARQLYQAADADYRRAAETQGPERARLFAAAAPQFAAAAERWPDSALAMDALFMAGESHFFADNYPQANKQYEKLVKAFPNNKYMDVVDQRRFAIAKYWIDKTHESPEAFYYVNFFDNSRPGKDARGSGVRVYKADEYYTDLRKAYPTSEHQFLAHFLGLKAKLNNYDGPAYSGAPLDEGEKLIKQMRRQFPQESEREREYLDRAAAEIRFHKAERLSFLARYYDRRAEYRAAEHYYARVVNEFNDTPLAARAQERIGQIADLPPVPPQKAQWLVNLLPESDPVKPLLEATEELRLAEAQRAATERNEEIQDDLNGGKEPSLVSGMISNFFDR
jgi:outer membrane protein assembly factor BamD (BamD/ComL family)